MPDLPPSVLSAADLPEADPTALLEAFLRVHASGSAVPVTLMARGLELHGRFQADPPALPQWGRFLVALGQLAADRLDDPAAASRFFLAALQQVDRHGDHEAAVTAGYNQGVLQERRQHLPMARGAYRTAAQEGFRLACVTGNTVRAAQAAVRLHFAEHGDLDDAHLVLLKRSWLGWLWLRQQQPAEIDADLRQDLGRTLCAFLLPEDDPGTLAARWREWPPATLATPAGSFDGNDLAALRDLFACAAESAAEHLADEVEDPAAPYRLLWEAAGRMVRG